MGWREGDPHGRDVGEPRYLVSAGPVLGPPLLERLGPVVGVHLHEPARGEQLVADVRPLGVERLQVHPAERRQQHGEVEEQPLDRPVELFIVDDAFLDARDVGPGDRPDPTLPEERLGPQFRGRLESLLGEGQPTDTKVA